MTDPARKADEPRDYDEQFSIDDSFEDAMSTILTPSGGVPTHTVVYSGPVIASDAVEDLRERHVGEWVAIENGRDVVASGDSFAKTYAAAENAGIKHPHVRFIETETPRYRA